MFNECELYYYEGLILDDDDIKELNMEKTNGIGLITLIQNYTNVFGIENGEIIEIDKEKLLNNVIKTEEEFCYIIRNNSLLLPPIKIYYGIKEDRILAVWENKQIRDIKLHEIRVTNICTIIEEMSNTDSFIKDFNKQKKLRKKYNSLTFKI